jgi:ABC-type transporter Mla MlaB component
MTFEKGLEATTLKLEGKVTAPWADELHRTWDELAADRPAKSIIVDLSDVTFIDSEGKSILSWMTTQGADLRAGNLMTKYVVDEILRRKNGSQGNGG